MYKVQVVVKNERRKEERLNGWKNSLELEKVMQLCKSKNVKN